MSVIGCECGRCKLTLAEDRPRMSLYCACKDCRQAIKWAALRGGKAPQKLPRPFYVRSDITAVEGEGFMKAYQLRDPARSTRVFCSHCYSILGINHPAYCDNVFMFFPHHCETDIDLSVEPCAVIHMESYSFSEPADIPAGIPVFQSWDDPREREVFLALPDVSDTFRTPEDTANGVSFSGLIETLGNIEVLGLEIGAEPL